MKREIESDKVPGLALAIVRGDRIEHLGSFGTAGPDKGPVTPRTSFVLGSMSKSFTAMAMLQLVDAGKVDLDLPVQEYLPWFRVTSAEDSSRITLRHLLNHTSGIPEYAPRADKSGATLEDHVRALSEVELESPPGEVHQYASPNYQVLGLVIEKVSGISFGDYVQKNIFKPLVMQNSFASKAEAEKAAMASGHRYVFGQPVSGGVSYEEDRLPTASLISSSRDMAHYLIAQLNNGRYLDSSVISSSGLAEMHKPAALTGEEAESYAMGWRVGELNGEPAIHHGGRLPDYRAKMVLLPSKGWGVVVLTNAGTMLEMFTGGSATSHRIADGVAGLLVGQQPEAAGPGLGRGYAVLALLVAVLVFQQFRQIYKLPRWRKDLQLRVVQKRGSTVRIALRSVWDIAVPALLLAAVPALTRMPWTGLILLMPDLGYSLLILWSIALGVGLIKASIVISTIRGKRAPSRRRPHGGKDAGSKETTREVTPSTTGSSLSGT